MPPPTTTRLFTMLIDGVAGKLARRPQLDKLLEYARPGDELVITRLDRLGRSVKNLCDLSDMLRCHDVDLCAIEQGIDTTTSGGRLFFHILAGIAEFERELLSERTLDGLDAARVRGRKSGRPPVMTADKRAVARDMYDSRKYTMEQIADTVGVSRTSLYRHLNKTAEESVRWPRS